MKNINIAEQINKTIEDIWISLEKEERNFSNCILNNQQHVLLTLIIRNPNSSPSELANKMEITKSAVSQQLAKLEKEGYITKVQHSDDKRAFSIVLEEKGAIYKKDLELFYQQMLNKYLSKFSSKELLDMLTSLQKFQEIL